MRHNISRSQKVKNHYSRNVKDYITSSRTVETSKVRALGQVERREKAKETYI